VSLEPSVKLSHVMIWKLTNCSPAYVNSTLSTACPPSTTAVVVGSTAVGTGSVTATAPGSVPTAGAGKAAVLSGAGLAGLVGLAAFVL
jgi:hypothetical protein